MTPAKAITQARKIVTPIYRRSRTDYVFYAPYDIANPNGLNVDVQRSTWQQALRARTERVAEAALVLAGVPHEDIYFREDDGSTVAELVAAVIERQKEQTK